MGGFACAGDGERWCAGKDGGVLLASDQQPSVKSIAVAPHSRGRYWSALNHGDNFTVKGHHISMIKDRKFNGHSRADPHKHIAEFVEVCGMFRYGNNNADAIKLKFFPSSLAGEAKIWFNELSPGVITTWEETRQAFCSLSAQKPANDLVQEPVLQSQNPKSEERYKRITKLRFKTLKQSYGRIADHQSLRPPAFQDVNDDTCFRMDVIDEITEDELDDLLDDSKPFLNTSEKISETPLDKEFDKFMSRSVQE
ncbi:hypothetical protein Tco_0894237 [Tanacetum coccineum]|uniref:Reverse transcriptase domain-containing protein n=1 Tax=Tanacetum coccineum TaxID=301880 RepID=A0ABQ5CB90_9ASTR